MTTSLKMTRRTALLLTVSAAALAATRTLGAATDALKGSGSIVVCTWGGSYTDAQVADFFGPFTTATGIQVTTTGTPDAAKLKLMHENGNVEWDLVDAEGQMMYAAIDEGALEKIDYNLIYSVTPKTDLIQTNLKDYGFPSISFGWVLAWNTKASFPNGEPASWADFWNVDKFPGRRALYANPKGLLEAALLADGVSKDAIYPLDLDRAFKKLDEIKSQIDVWYEDLGQADALMKSSEVDMLFTSNGRAHAAKQGGLPVDFTFNDGAWEQGYWVVPAGAPNLLNAMKLIAWTSQPEGEAAFAKAFGYGGPNIHSYDGLDPAVLDGMPTAPANLPKQVAIDSEWWTKNLDTATSRWTDWYANK